MLVTKIGFANQVQMKAGVNYGVSINYIKYRMGDAVILNEINKILLTDAGVCYGIFNNKEMFIKHVSKICTPINIFGVVGFDYSDISFNKSKIKVFTVKENCYYHFKLVNSRYPACEILASNDKNFEGLNQKSKKTNQNSNNIVKEEKKEIIAPAKTKDLTRISIKQKETYAVTHAPIVKDDIVKKPIVKKEENGQKNEEK